MLRKADILYREYAEGLAVLGRLPLPETEMNPLPVTNLHIGTTPRIALAATVETPVANTGDQHSS